MRLPFVAISNELLLIVEKFLVPECGVLEVRSFNDGVNRTGFLAKAAEDALGHIDVILGSTARTIRTGFRLNCNCESRAGGFTKFTGNTSLFSSRVTSEGMLSSEHGRKRSLFPRVVNDMIRLKSTPSSEEHRRPGELSHEDLSVKVLGNVTSFNFLRNFITSQKSHVLLVLQELRIESVRVVVL